MEIVVLLGAGFSKWSCDLPLISGLFDFEIQSYNSTEQGRIIRLKKIYERWRALHPKEHPEAFIRYSQGPPLRFNLVNWYITRRLTEPFVVHGSRRYTWYINSYYPRDHGGVQKAREFIEFVLEIAGVGNLGLVTTNYDLIPEYALGTRAFNYGVPGEQIGFTPYPYPQPVYLGGGIPIAKLHGSISWNEKTKFADSRCGLTGKCLIVPPVTEKQAPALLKQQWSVAKRLLGRANKLLVFGFSFNEYDTAIRRFLAKNLRPRASIVLIDIVDHRQRLSRLFKGHEMNYVDCALDGVNSGLKPFLISRRKSAD